jgi:hypothetical protein
MNLAVSAFYAASMQLAAANIKAIRLCRRPAVFFAQDCGLMNILL